MTGRIPSWLPPSAVTDIDLLMLGLKPAARLYVGERGREIRGWARVQGLFCSADRDGYAVLSRSGATARRVLDVDRRPGRHAVALGRMLGYPECCTRAAAKVGDEGIDAMCDAVAARRFRGKFKGIDPGAYRAGRALLSHVPCSHNCGASAKLAMRRSEC
ncbi:hypothetical protein [Sphingomonas sp. NPDC079357]|uniref:hypothetical protein n=1 Tax=Sphingomonas sp. NPDC079357 TaxID=3364518 RepID=UPI00384CAADF